MKADAYEKKGGAFYITTTGKGDVVIQHSALEVDANGMGYIVFTPGEARNLADMLNGMARKAESEHPTEHPTENPTKDPV